MRKKLTFVVFIMFLLGFLGYKYIDFQYNIQKSNNLIPALINFESFEKNNINILQFKKETPKKIDNPFFTTVFEKVKLGVSFEVTENFAKSTGYFYISEKSGENNISTIKVYENSNQKGNKINLVFMYNNKLEMETLKGISYIIPEQNKEIIIENLSDDTKDYYTQYRFHIVGKEYGKVDNIQDLAKFLFYY